MEHLKNITNFIESSTYPVLGKQLQHLLLSKQNEFLVKEIEAKLKEDLFPYVKELHHDMTFNVTLYTDGKISVNISNDDVESEYSDKEDLLYSPEVESSVADDYNTEDDFICLSTSMYIDDSFSRKGVVYIKPQFHGIVERILNVPLRKIFNMPVEIELDDRLYDATLNCFDEGKALCKETNFSLQLKWSCHSALGRDINVLLASRPYKYFTLTYNRYNSSFKINLFKQDPYELD